jgi:hypothetical protein
VTFDFEEWLSRILPALLADAPGAAAPRRVIQLVVMDREECAFTYVLEGSEVHVERGIADAFDLGIALPGADLEAFAKNRLDVRRALHAGRLKVTGDESLLLWLADRLARARY